MSVRRDALWDDRRGSAETGALPPGRRCHVARSPRALEHGGRLRALRALAAAFEATHPAALATARLFGTSRCCAWSTSAPPMGSTLMASSAISWRSATAGRSPTRSSFSRPNAWLILIRVDMKLAWRPICAEAGSAGTRLGRRAARRAAKHSAAPPAEAHQRNSPGTTREVVPLQRPQPATFAPRQPARGAFHDRAGPPFPRGHRGVTRPPPRT
jgi:hypothetical protein